MSEAEEDITWLAMISDAFSFRHAFTIIKYKLTFVTMLITPEILEISFKCDNDKSFHRILISTEELEKYYYNIRDENNQLKGQHFIAFHTETFYNAIRSFTKRDSFKMFFKKSEEYLYLQPIKNSSKEKSENNTIMIKLCVPDNIIYEDMEFPPENKLKILSKKFSDICSQTNSQKCTQLKIVTKDDKIIFKAYKNQEKVFINSSSSTLSSTSNSGKKESIFLPIENIKHFTKIHNISPQGSLIEICYSSKCFRFTSKLGIFGSYEIYFFKN
jgi:hypothetical protein